MGRYFAVAILAWMVSLPAYPVLNVGAMAPNFVTQASLGGKAFTYSLADELKKGRVSHEDIEKLNKFSVSECRSKFPVAADADQSIMKSYDAILAAMPEYANRVSYVIAPDSKIIYTYTDLRPGKHAEITLEALRRWNAGYKPNLP